MEDTIIYMKSADSIIAAGVAIAIVLVVIFSIFLFSGQVFRTQKLIEEKTGIETEAKIIEGYYLSAFYEGAYVDQESMVLSIIPTSDMASDYTVSYDIEKQYGGNYSREEVVEGVSPENPIVITVSRMADEWVDIFVKVHDKNGTLVWESNSGYA